MELNKSGFYPQPERHDGVLSAVIAGFVAGHDYDVKVSPVKKTGGVLQTKTLFLIWELRPIKDGNFCLVKKTRPIPVGQVNPFYVV